MLDRKIFFDAVRPKLFQTGLEQAQVDGLTKILDEWERRALTDMRWLAYMLATVFHETAEKMQPVREAGGDTYLRAKPYFPWVGMGLVQVTWEVNGRKFGAAKPEDLLSWPVALKALFDGMTKGMFTGRKLVDYFDGSSSDPINARRIINGIDRAPLIAGYHADFLAAISTASKAPPKIAGPVVDAGLTAKPPLSYQPPVLQQHAVAQPSVAPKQTWGDWFKSAFFARKAS